MPITCVTRSGEYFNNFASLDLVHLLLFLKKMIITFESLEDRDVHFIYARIEVGSLTCGHAETHAWKKKRGIK